MTKKNTVIAYAPAHITGFFRAYQNGSTGAGINLKEGVTTKASSKKSAEKKITVKINGKKQKGHTSLNVIEEYLKIAGKKHEIDVLHQTRIPIGFGLGASGAGALSLSLALNESLGTGLSKKHALEIARQAEIKAKTGLGDVIAQQFRGLMVGLPPFPSTKVKIIPSTKKFVACAFFSPISTKKVLSNPYLTQAINIVGDYCMKKILEKKTPQRFMWLSRLFTLASGLSTPRTRMVMKKIPFTSQAMLGNTTFTLTDKPKETQQLLSKYCNRTLVSKVAKKGAHVL